MKEHLWTTQRRTQAVFDLIQELRWDDQAARDMRMRYFHPLEGDSQEMLTAYKDQDNSLEMAGDQIKDAKRHMLAAYNAGSHVAREHRHFQEEIRRAYQEYEQTRAYESSARHQLPQILSLIESAYRAGE